MAKKKAIKEANEKKVIATLPMCEYEQLLVLKSRTKLSIADLVRNGVRRVIAENINK